MVAANCIWMFGEISVYPPRYHKSFCLCIQSRRGLLNERISHTEWASEWVGGRECLSPFLWLFFLLSSDVAISENLSNWRTQERCHLKSRDCHPPKHAWKISFTCLCPTSHLTFPNLHRVSKNIDKCHLVLGPLVRRNRQVSLHLSKWGKWSGGERGDCSVTEMDPEVGRLRRTKERQLWNILQAQT